MWFGNAKERQRAADEAAALVRRQADDEITTLKLALDTKNRRIEELEERLERAAQDDRNLRLRIDKLEKEVSELKLKPELNKQEAYAAAAEELGFKPPVGFLVNGSTLAAAFLAQKRNLEIQRQEVDHKSAQVQRQLDTIEALRQIPAKAMTAIEGGAPADTPGNTIDEKPQSTGSADYRGQKGPRQKDFTEGNWREQDSRDLGPSDRPAGQLEGGE